MWDFSVGQSLALMGRTAPFIVFRIIVYVGIVIAYLVASLVGAGIGFGIGSFGDAGFRTGASVWGGVVGFVIVGGILLLMREYLLYVVKAGHIAVLVELLDGNEVPEGRGQIDYATSVVKARFVETSVLFGIDQLVKGVLRAILGIVQGIASLLPLPGLEQFMGLVRAFLQIAVGFVDEVILAFAIRTKASNPWDSSKTALVYYAQNYRPMLKNAAWLTVITYGITFVIFLIMLVPAGAIVAIFQNGWSAAGLIFAILFAWAIKAALIEPFAICCMMQAYFRTIAGQMPDPVWDERLTTASGKFREIKDKAATWIGGRVGVTTPPPPTPAV